MRVKYVMLGDANSPHFYKWYKELIKKYDVYVVSFNENSTYQYSKCYIFSSYVAENGGNYNILRHLVSVYRLLKVIRPSIVNAHYLTSYGFIASLLSIVLPFRLVSSAWGSDILVTPKRNYIWLLVTKFVLRQSEFVTSDSLNMSGEIQKIYNCKVVTFPMGIDEKCISYNSKKNSIYTFLSLRNLIPNSNIDVIIKAIAVVSEQHNVQLIVANDGCDRFKLGALVKELGLCGVVKFVGYLKHDQLFDLMRSCHTYVTIPTSDALSVSLMEALASEMLVIASDLPANRELLNSRNSLITNIEIDSLVRAMEDGLNFSATELAGIYRFNRKLLKENCLWSDNINTLYDALKLNE